MRWYRPLVRVLAMIGLVEFVLAGVVAGQEGAHRTLPRLDDPSTQTEVTGRIADSTRGKSGPVRLVLRGTGKGAPGSEGDELAVLVALDADCDRLGLTLARGEEVTVIGHLMSGVRPLLVAQTVVVDGRRVEVRESR